MANDIAANELLRPNRSESYRSIERTVWEEFLADYVADGYMLTLGFRCYLDPAYALQTANHFHHNQAINSYPKPRPMSF